MSALLDHLPIAGVAAIAHGYGRPYENAMETLAGNGTRVKLSAVKGLMPDAWAWVEQDEYDDDTWTIQIDLGSRLGDEYGMTHETSIDRLEKRARSKWPTLDDAIRRHADELLAGQRTR